MMDILLQEDSIISPLGFSTSENINAIKAGNSGLQFHANSRFQNGGFYAGIIDPTFLADEFSALGDAKKFTKLEQMMLLAIQSVLNNNKQIDLKTTALIISSTKGNINLWDNPQNFSEDRASLNSLGKIIQNFFGFELQPIIVSNACISGGLAVAIAKRFIQAGKFDNAVVVAGDLVSDFVTSGFQSFQALSNSLCRPFSKTRDGISLGEAAAAVLVSSEITKGDNIALIGDASANDANHISGPSRTGEGLYKSIQQGLKEAQLSASEIDYLSAHGTATVFNDEMEAVAFNRAGLNHVPINSFKGFYGHTLGASALIETILAKHSLLNNELYPSLNFEELGVSKPINIIQNLVKKELQTALKTASGFGGCNLALILKKINNG
ncbi:beta-ketoacyl synthase N-terminal-like domain-containing protein [Gillisia marina]|uniref:beta-ketoacyl synthase N-terminal-like domain-containing protein n=1 Tax=Gillisia marina TaxID=1167637 RepID=UPI00029B4A12|nr:beta-ketoacyl synthase N-terminal-like domain-containing protein [Gillisia marina]